MYSALSLAGQSCVPRCAQSEHGTTRTNPSACATSLNSSLGSTFTQIFTDTLPISSWFSNLLIVAHHPCAPSSRSPCIPQQHCGRCSGCRQPLPPARQCRTCALATQPSTAISRPAHARVPRHGRSARMRRMCRGSLRPASSALSLANLCPQLPRNFAALVVGKRVHHLFSFVTSLGKIRCHVCQPPCVRRSSQAEACELVTCSCPASRASARAAPSRPGWAQARTSASRCRTWSSERDGDGRTGRWRRTGRCPARRTR